MKWIKKDMAPIVAACRRVYANNGSFRGYAKNLGQDNDDEKKDEGPAARGGKRRTRRVGKARATKATKATRAIKATKATKATRAIKARKATKARAINPRKERVTSSKRKYINAK